MTMTRALWSATKSAFLIVNGVIVVVAWMLMVKYGALEIQDHIDPFDHYFAPRWLYIPDHCEGDNPRIEYGRAIERDFTAVYEGNFFSSDPAQFPIRDPIPRRFDYHTKPYGIARPLLSEFTGNDIKPPSGIWSRQECWTRHMPGRSGATVCLTSNHFNVWPPDDPRCQSRR